MDAAVLRSENGPGHLSLRPELVSAGFGLLCEVKLPDGNPLWGSNPKGPLSSQTIVTFPGTSFARKNSRRNERLCNGRRI